MNVLLDDNITVAENDEIGTGTGIDGSNLNPNYSHTNELSK